VLGVLLQPLGKRTSSRLLTSVFAIVALFAAAMIFGEVSAKLGEMTSLGAAALVACAIGCWIDRTVDATGMIPACVILIGGSTFVGHIDPSVPLRGMLLIPFAPLALYVGMLGPIARLRPWQRIAAQLAGVAVVLGAAAGITLWR